MALLKAVSAVLPLAIGAVGSQRTFQTVVSTVQSIEKHILLNRPSFIPFLQFPTKQSFDENLIREIDSSIDNADRSKWFIPENPCTTVYPDGITIHELSIKKPHEVSEHYSLGLCDENLPEAFHEYLEIRGIKPSTIYLLLQGYIKKKKMQ